MSRGLGRIERAILMTMTDPDAEFATWPPDHLLDAVVDLSARARDEYRPTHAERETFNRAVRSLARKGLIDRVAFPAGLAATPEGYALAAGSPA